MTNALAQHLDNWTAQRDQRLQVGDDLEMPRAIDHFAYFRSKSAARAAARDFEVAGYTVGVKLGLLRSSVEASRMDPLTDADVARFLGEVVAIVTTHGGTYDGFGGTVVPPS